MLPNLSQVALTLTRLIPVADREAIVGDLFEDADYRHLSGARLELWLCAQVTAIGAGLAVNRLGDAITLPPIREMAAGVALDGSHAVRGVIDAPWTALGRVALFCASIATLAAAAEVLIAALFSAAGLQGP